MEAFAGSYSMLFAKVNTNKPLPPVKTLLGRPSILFTRSGNSTMHVLHHASSLRHKAIRSVASPQTRVLTNTQGARTGFQPSAPVKTVHVQFQLHKKCSFGELFFLVGNEPIIGEWNPSSAVPLNWSDGDIWTVELDVPIDRAIQFKFILEQRTGDLLWQPGPDRILHTSDTNNTITVTEDWKHAGLQKLTEVKTTGRNEETQFTNSGMGVIENTILAPANLRNANKAATFLDNPASAIGIPNYRSNNESAYEEGALLQERQEACSSPNGVCVMTRPVSLNMEEEDECCEVEYYDDEYYNIEWEYEDKFEDEDTMFTYEENDLVPSFYKV